MRRSIFLTLVVAGALVAVGAGGYFVGRRPPPLAAPLVIDSAMALADGGSLHLVLRDAEGRLYGIGVSGGLRPRREFEVYVQPWYSVFPVPVPIRIHSQEEADLLVALERWRGQLSSAQPGTEILDDLAIVLRRP